MKPKKTPKSPIQCLVCQHNMGRSRVKDGKIRCNKCKSVYDVSVVPGSILVPYRKSLLKLVYPDLVQFIRDLYAMPRDPSYFIKLPQMPPSIQELVN